MAGILEEPLVRISGTTLYQVDHGSNAVRAISNGNFLIAYTSPSDDAVLLAQVGPISWPLSHNIASLRFDNHTYAFELLPSASHSAAAPATAVAAAAAATGGQAAGQGAAFSGSSHYYCLTLQPDTPLELIDLLQAILASGSAYHDQEHIALQPQPVAPEAEAARGAAPQPAAPGTADRIAVGLQRGGQLAAAGVLAMATWAGGALHRGAEAAVARMQPADRPANISPAAQARLEKAKVVASKLAEVSGRAVGGALGVTAQVAGALAQRIASSDIGQSIGRSRVGSASAQDLRKVGVAGIEAVEAVYDSLADAARIVLAHTHTATTRVVGHKYGADAALATGAGFAVVQSAAETGLNVYKLRPTALAKKVVKGTAQNVVRGNNGNGTGANGTANGNSGQQQQQQQQQQQAPRPQAPAPHGPPPPAAAAAVQHAAAAPAPPPPAAATAAATLAAVTGAQRNGAAAAAGPSSSAAGAGAAAGAGSVVDGIAVTGPVPAHPVVVDYTPSAAVAYGSGAGNGGGSGGGLPYPAVSQGQYAARYYPAVPQA